MTSLRIAVLSTIALLALGTAASAQPDKRDRNDRYDRYERNDGRDDRPGRRVGQQRRYQRVAFDSEAAKQSIRRAEDAADRFQKALNSALDDSRLDETREEKVIDGQAKELENALDRLRKDFDDDDQQETRRQLRFVLSESRQFSGIMRNGWARPARDEWLALDRELQFLARMYDLDRQPY